MKRYVCADCLLSEMNIVDYRHINFYRKPYFKTLEPGVLLDRQVQDEAAPLI